jgi:non-heme chloroperoxidase
MSTITVSDGTEIYFKDWGDGRVVTFSHGWPLWPTSGTRR